MTSTQIFAAACLLFAVSPLAASSAQAQSIEPFPDALRVAVADGQPRVGAGARGHCPANVEPLASSFTRASRLRSLLDLQKLAEGRATWNVDAMRDVRSVATLACAHSGDPNARAWVQAFRQLIANATGIDDAGIDAFFAAALGQQGRRWETDCASVPALDRSATPDARLERQFLRALACDDGSRVLLGQGAYWIDRADALAGDGGLSPLTRAGFVDQALRSWRYRGIGVDAEVQVGSDFAGWVAARMDVEALDLTQTRRALAATSLGATEQALALVRVGRIKTAALALGRAWRAAVARVPSLAALVDTGPREALAHWRRDSAAHAAALRRAWAVETGWLGGGGAALAGCDGPLEADLLAYLRAQAPQTLDEAHAALERPVGYLLAAALLTCHHALGHDGPARAMQDELLRLAPQRGPRMAALNRLRRAAVQLTPRDGVRMPLASFDPAGQLRDEEDWVRSSESRAGSRQRGTVARVRRSGGSLEVEYRTESVTVDVRNCTPTNRIRRIERDGNVVYEQNCTTVGERTFEVTPDPVSIPASFGEGIQPGVWLEANRGLRETRALPMEVRSGPDGEVRAFFGVPVRSR